MVRGDRSLPRRVAVATGAIVLVLLWWTWLRPTSLGGDAAYVIVDGSSMEPTYDDGDLVLVRGQGEYGAGDIIAFRAGGVFDDPTRIIHRIVDEVGDGTFVTQGDNRDETDPWQPGPDDIIGRAVFHVPIAGRVAGWVTSPYAFAALGATAVLAGGRRNRRRRQRDRVTSPDPQPTMNPTSPPPSPGRHRVERRYPQSPSQFERFTHPRWAFVGLVACVALVVPVLGSTWSALRAPDSLDRTVTVGIIDSAISPSYRFIGPKSDVYPSGVVAASPNAVGSVTPEGPLFAKLLDRLEIDLVFRAQGTGADQVEGVRSIDVTVEAAAGWSETLESVDSETFSGDDAEALTVDLDDVAQRVADVTELTGVGDGEHTITVTPRLSVTGSSEGVSAEDQLVAPLTFVIDGSTIVANAGEQSSSQPIARTVDERARYAIGPFEMDTQLARGVLSGLSLVLVAGIAWFASVLFGGVGLGEPARIAARYRSQIVDVAVATSPPGPVVMVSSIDELVRIAKIEQTVILHEDLGFGAHRYRVFLGSVAYEYETAPEHPGSATDEAAAANAEATED